MKIAVIPARGGSKRIPGKNSRDFAGQPMITWPVRAAIQSGCFDKVVVSTDSDTVANVSEKAGADVPFRRPPELSDDFTPLRPVVNHAIEWLDEQGCVADYVCTILPTAAFLQSAAVQRAFEILKASEADFVFSATTYPYPIQRSFRLAENERPEWNWPENRLRRSQDLEEAFHDAGQFYWGRREAFLSGIDAISADSRIFRLAPHLVHDIDTEEDWVRAELTFKALGLRT